MSSTDVPSSRRTWISRPTSATVSGARPSVGSSMRTSFGSAITALAIANCDCSPPERVLANEADRS